MDPHDLRTGFPALPPLTHANVFPHWRGGWYRKRRQYKAYKATGRKMK